MEENKKVDRVQNLTDVFFEDVEIGQTWRSSSRTVTDHDLHAFTELSGDRLDLHVDDQAAGDSRFGRRIAQGLLGAVFASGLREVAGKPKVLLGLSICVKFKKPIFVGDSLHLEEVLVEKRSSKPREGVAIYNRQLINQKGEVLQEGQVAHLVVRRDG
jgi:acyl dehydratase